MESTEREVEIGESVLVDARNLIREHVEQPRRAIEVAGLSENVRFWP